MSKLLIIPHVGVSGGAGLYINQVLKEFSKKYKVYVGGVYASSFNVEEYTIPPSINKVVIPYYKGVAARAYWFHFFRSLFYIPRLLLALNNNNNKDFEVVVLTSGIQILLLPLIRRFFKKAKIIILVQENFRLDGYILGGVIKRYFSSIDVVVSITLEWKDYSEKYKIKPILFRNMFYSDKTDKTSSCEKDIDFIYLGGDQKIKGFSEFVLFCHEMSKIKQYKAAVLGEVSKYSQDLMFEVIEKSEFNNEIVFFGFLNDVSDIIKRSKVMLLPITAPHFCRPAIEAGFEKVPFLIRRHSDMNDFAIEDYNCQMYDNLQEMVDKATVLIEDNEYNKKMGINNFNNSSKFIYSHDASKSFLKEIEGALK